MFTFLIEIDFIVTSSSNPGEETQVVLIEKFYFVNQCNYSMSVEVLLRHPLRPQCQHIEPRLDPYFRTFTNLRGHGFCSSWKAKYCRLDILFLMSFVHNYIKYFILLSKINWIEYTLPFCLFRLHRFLDLSYRLSSVYFREEALCDRV